MGGDRREHGVDAENRRSVNQAPFEIARLAERHGKRVIGFAGSIEDELPGFDACIPIANGPLTLDESRLRAAELLRAAAARTARLLKITL